MRQLTPSLLLLAASLQTVLSAPNCPPLGPVFEPPRNLRSSPAFRTAIANLTATLTARDRDNSDGVRSNITSYGIEVFSAFDEDDAGPVFE